LHKFVSKVGNLINYYPQQTGQLVYLHKS